MKILLIGYGIKDWCFYNTLKKNFTIPITIRLLYNAPLCASPWFIFSNWNLGLECYRNLPNTFGRKSIFSLTSIFSFLSFLKKPIENNDQILLQGKDRYFEFVAFFLALKLNKKIYFFESAFPGFIYLSLNGVSGDAKLIKSICSSSDKYCVDERFPILEYFRFGLAQLFYFGNKIEFNYAINQFKKINVFQKIDFVKQDFDISDSIIFLGQVVNDVNHKKFGISVEEISFFIYSNFAKKAIYLKVHPREPLNHINKNLLSSLSDCNFINCDLMKLVNKNNIFITVNSTSALEIKYYYPAESVFVLGKSFFEQFVNSNRELEKVNTINKFLIPSGYRRGNNFVSHNLINTLKNVL